MRKIGMIIGILSAFGIVFGSVMVFLGVAWKMKLEDSYQNSREAGHVIMIGAIIVMISMLVYSL